MDERMTQYARLLVEVGANIQKGQELLLIAPVERADFVRLCVEAAYKAGAKDVTICWRDDFETRQKYLYADSSVFEHVPAWRYHMYTDIAKRGGALLSLTAVDPNNLSGVDPARTLAAERAQAAEMKEFRALQMTDSIQWCIGGVPIESWAKKVFPNEENCVDKLWNAIFKTALVEHGGDAVSLWREKQKDFVRRTKHLNERKYKALHYKNSLGTDFTVGLPEGHIWEGGSSLSRSGVLFLPNIPTEEIFTAPSRMSVNGVICASLPLIKNGNIASGFKFTVKDGKITDVAAEKGLEVLKAAIDVDEGARRFGEVALVPYDSAISQMNTLFYNTLYDENASCHFAFGAAYPGTIAGGEDMTDEQFMAAGGNVSGTHVDFMVGTPDLSIDGICEDGSVEQVFVNGVFAF